MSSEVSSFYVLNRTLCNACAQVLHMMMGLERIERMRLFAAELTAPTSPAPRASRIAGSRAPARRTGELAAADPPQEPSLQGRSRQSTRGSGVSTDGGQPQGRDEAADGQSATAERPAASGNQLKVRNARWVLLTRSGVGPPAA